MRLPASDFGLLIVVSGRNGWEDFQSEGEVLHHVTDL